MASPEDDLYSGPEPPSYKLRADAVRRDIYNRHRIPDDTPVAEAADVLASSGQYGHEWESPQQRSEAAARYVRNGRPEQATYRWGQRGYLMSPGDAAYHNKYGRDATFLQNLVDETVGKPFRSQAALDRWDRNHAPLHRRDVFSPNTYVNSTGTNLITSGVLDAIGNTDTAVGGFLYGLNDWPATTQTNLSGDAKSLPDAYRQAKAVERFTRDSKTNNSLNQSAIRTYGMSSGDMLAHQRKMDVPMSAQRYGEQRHGQMIPPGYFTDAIDFVTEMGDKTLPFSVIGGTAASVARDLAQDVAGNVALKQAAGLNAERTWPEYLFAHNYREGADGPPLRTVEQQAEAAALRRRLADMQERGNTPGRQAQGLSASEAAAVQQLHSQGYFPLR